ncbi:MAG: phosphate ABC transporter permease subunit PstC [Dehalococcoidia bacterium]|nr:phosphate ABC transporter permease subunit PstC [Dehalococcoidia bacterium]
MSRYTIDRYSSRVVFAFGMTSFVILVLIAGFIMRESLPALREVGLIRILFGSDWYPRYDEYGILTMVVGSVVVTTISLALALPLSLGAAVLLAEVAPPRVRAIVRPAIELLVGIPSVVFGLVGMVALAPLIADIGGSGSGSSVLAASIVLAVMVLPTITSISEDSIRALPRTYKEGALALGATHWQTIWRVMVPAAKRGIMAGTILGTGRAIGETMAMVMVIGNAPIFPAGLLSPARTLTGNIAVEIAAATGIHQSVLYVTGLVLFVMVMIINSASLLAYKRRAS